ncbi:MAG: universal stress protein [Deltaproteobacteria bacterium]|nr:universal stress protein [Deltaproteobacteria bacterium]
MAAQKILLPYNHTPQDRKALSFVIETFGQRGEVQITLFNTYAPLPEIDMSSSPELGKLRGGLAALQEEFRERESGLKVTRHFLLQNGFNDEQVDYVFMKREKSIPEDILDAANRGHYDVIVLSGREAGRVARMLSRSVHERILRAAAGITVCIAK